MAFTKLEKIASIEEEIRQLENRRKQLLAQQKEQERKARTKRLIERGAILESFIAKPDTLTNEQIKLFLEKTITSNYALRILDTMRTQPVPETAEHSKTAQEKYSGVTASKEDISKGKAG